MPTASLLLPLLARLRRLIPSVLALLPVLLRPPPMAPRLSPLALALPRFVPRPATFALRPLAFLASRPPGLALWPRQTTPARPTAPPYTGPPLAPSPSGRAPVLRRQARQACVRLIPLLGESNRVGRVAPPAGRRHRRGQPPGGLGSGPVIPAPGDKVGVDADSGPGPPKAEHLCWGVKGWGEGLPVEASPRGAITPSRPHPAPIPTKKRPAATEEFFPGPKNS